MVREIVSPPPRNPDNYRKHQSIRLTQQADDTQPSQMLVVKPEFKQIIQRALKDPQEIRSGPDPLKQNWRVASGRKMRKRKSRKMRMRKRKSRKMRMRKI
jgi:hypothetical protein